MLPNSAQGVVIFVMRRQPDRAMLFVEKCLGGDVIVGYSAKSNPQYRPPDKTLLDEALLGSLTCVGILGTSWDVVDIGGERW